MPDSPSFANAAEWIAVIDAVLAISSAAECDPAAAAEVLLTFTKSVSVEVSFCGYFVEDFTGDGDEHLPKLSSTISSEDWHAFFLANDAECHLDWNKSCLVFSSYSSQDHNKGGLDRVTTYTNVRFRRTDLKYFLAKEKQKAGRKFGAFWPKLAEEAAVYFHDNGAPDQEYGSQANAIKTIMDALAFSGVDVGATAVRDLVSAITARLLKDGKTA